MASRGSIPIRLVSRRAVVAAICLTPLAWGQQLTEEQIWERFGEWARGQQNKARLPERYRAKLIGDGLPQAEVDRQMAVILDRSPESQRRRIDAFWEKAASTPGNAAFRVTPSEWLVQAVKNVKPGRALDLDMAQGRNSLFLAQQGWDVTGIDFSEVAVTQARQQAEKLGVKYTATVLDIDHWDFGIDRWDLIASIFEPDIRWASKICQGLKSGGLFVRENLVFETEDNAVLKAFLALRILRYEDRVDTSNYSPDGATVRPGWIIRMVAQKV